MSDQECKLKIVYKNINELKPFTRNPKDHPKEQIDNIAKSIEKYGWRQAILVSFESGEIVAGHGRLLAAKKLKLEKVPCIDASDMTPEQIAEYRYLDNKLNESDWNMDILKEDLDKLDFSDFDIKWDDFDSAFDEDGAEVIEDDYEEELPEEPKAKKGQIFKLGRHRLMCGDSTSQDDVIRLMGGRLADLLITDPPYNVDYGSEKKLSVEQEKKKKNDGHVILNDKMKDEEFRSFLTSAFSAADAVMKPGACFYIWHADSEGYNFRGSLRDVGWKIRQTIIWNKNAFVMGRQDYQWKHEPCLYGWKDGAGHLWASDRKQSTVIDMPRPTKADIHPTMKPIALFDYQIKNNTKGEDTVLDLFNGSGTTIMACEQDGRNACCMELDPRYVDAAIDRWETFTGQKAVLIEE